MDQNRQLDSVLGSRSYPNGELGGTLRRRTFGESRDQELAIFRLLRVMRRQLWMIALITALALIFSIGAVAMLKDRYKATALLVLDQTEGRLLGSQDQTA